MKRSGQEVAGGPRIRDAKPAVAGRRAQSRIPEAASVQTGAVRRASRPATEKTELLADFADFMSGEEELELGLLPAPDATFKERLRRRLWRTFVLSYLRGGGETSH